MIQTRIETQDFVHPQLGREVTAIGAYYVFGKEIRLPYNILNIIDNVVLYY